MLHKNILLIIVLVFSLFVISQVHAQGLEFSDVKEKIIQTGKYEIRITGDEFEWVEDVQIDKGYIKIIAKEEKDRKKAMPEKISVYSKSKTKEKELTKYKDKGKDIFLMEWNHEIEYKKIAFRGITFSNITYLKKVFFNLNYPERSFLTNDSSLYCSVARLYKIPLFPFKDRNKHTSDFFRNEYDKYSM